jgi:hypothetical protein
MKWKDKLEQWKNGIIQTYPKNIKKRFFYETSVCHKDLHLWRFKTPIFYNNLYINYYKNYLILL